MTSKHIEPEINTSYILRQLHCMVTKRLAVYFVWSIDTTVYVSKANACAFNL